MQQNIYKINPFLVVLDLSKKRQSGQLDHTTSKFYLNIFNKINENMVFLSGVGLAYRMLKGVVVQTHVNRLALVQTTAGKKFIEKLKRLSSRSSLKK